MLQKAALLIGATGLTGSHLLTILLESEAYHTVYVYSRRSLGVQHPKLKELIIDFDTYQGTVEAETVFCCLGTTMDKAKTKEAFKKVDLDYPIKFAQLQYLAGSKQFLVISAMGADIDSLFFYSRVKAEMENKLRLIGYPQLTIFRPALIAGNRTEHRAGEKLAAKINGWINPILIGPLKKYQSVPAITIAKAMYAYASSKSKDATEVILSDAIKELQ